MADYEEKIDLSIYSSHPSEYTFSFSKLKKMHFCSSNCTKKNPGQKCFQDLYKEIVPKHVWHICPPDCQIKNRYPTLKHVALKVGATEECLVEELPFLDQMRFKLENSEVSWKSSLLSVMDFLSIYRSPCFLDYEAMEEENSIFSVTIGSTPEIDIAETISNFIAKVKSSGLAVSPIPSVLCAFDVEGQRSHADSAVIPAKIHLGNFSCFLEINLPLTNDKRLRGEGCGLSPSVNSLFNNDSLLLVGNDCTADLGLIKTAFSLLEGKEWNQTGSWIDVCSLWTSIGGWSKDSVGLAMFRYQTLGGILQKNFKLSCAPDWALSYKKMPWQFTVYNIGDLTSILGSLYVFFIVIIPTILPSPLEIMSESNSSETAAAEFLCAVILQTFDCIPFNSKLYQGTRNPYSRREIIRDPAVVKLKNIIGEPILAIRPSWNERAVDCSRLLLRLAKDVSLKWTILHVASKPRDSMDVLTVNVSDEISENEDILMVDADVEELLESSLESIADDDKFLECPLEVVHSLSSSEPVRSSTPNIPLSLEQSSTPIRISRFAERTSFVPSGYNPTKSQLDRLLRLGIPHIALDRHGKEYTRKSGGNWKNYLSCREMVKEVGLDSVLQMAKEEPYRVLRWFNAVTPWKATPGPTDFRFSTAKFYIKIRKTVEKELGIKIANKHPFYRIRGGRNLRH